jgi:hypothetical protein
LHEYMVQTTQQQPYNLDIIVDDQEVSSEN